MSIDQEDQDIEATFEEVEPEADVTAAVNDALRQILATDPGVLLDAIAAALKIAKDAAQIPKDRFHIVIIPDVGDGYVETASSFDELLVIWRKVRQQPGQAFGFRGDILLPSKGGHYVVTPWGRFPLFTDDHDTEVDPKGYMGPVPPIVKVVPVTAPPAPAVNGDDEQPEQDEFDDGVDEDDITDDDDD